MSRARPNPRRLRRARAGFTLVEMMVALTAGAFAVAGAYYLTGTSSRLFNEQMSMSEVSSSLRMAMEQIRRDVSRAGFLTARSRTELYDCAGQPDTVTTSPKDVDAFSVKLNERSARTAQLLNVGASANQNLVRADRLVLNGNYASSDAYLTNTAFNPSLGTVIALQPGHESFQRSFTTPTGPGGSLRFDPVRFNAMFRTDRMLRIEDLQTGRVFFRQIIGTAPGDETAPQIWLDDVIPAQCFNNGQVAVSPAVRVRYQIESPSDDRNELGAGYENSGALTTEHTLLVRRELSTLNASTRDTIATDPVAGSARVVLDYAVEFQVNAWVDTNTPANGQVALGSVPQISFADETSAGGAQTVEGVSNLTPNQFRSAVISIAARTPEADDRLTCQQRTNLRMPLMTFRVPADDAYARCARVRSLKSEIFMPNMAFR